MTVRNRSTPSQKTADPDATQVWRVRRLPCGPTSVTYAQIKKAVRATIKEREAKEKAAGKTGC